MPNDKVFIKNGSKDVPLSAKADLRDAPIASLTRQRLRISYL
jgi:hypothetical protein